MGRFEQMPKQNQASYRKASKSARPNEKDASQEASLVPQPGPWSNPYNHY